MPDGWKRAPLGDFATLDIDRVPVERGCEYPIAGVMNAGQGLFARDAIDGGDTNYAALHRLHAGQLVMRKLTAWEGPITCVPEAFDGFHVSAEFPTFTLAEGLLPEYMSLVCQRPEFWDAMKDRSTGSVQRRKRVSPRQLLGIAVDVPPVTEQRRIADLVRAVDDAIGAASQVENRARASLAAELVESMPSPDSGDTAVGALASVNIGGLWGADPGVDEVDVLVYRSTEFAADGRPRPEGAALRSISSRALSSRRLLADDILLEKSGGTPTRPVGRVVRFADDARGPVIPSNFLQLLRPDATQVVPGFMFWLLWSWHSTLLPAQFQTASTNIHNLRTKEYLGIGIDLPEREIQARLVSLADAQAGLVQAASRNLAALRRLRKGLLRALLSGDHQLPDAYDRLLRDAT